MLDSTRSSSSAEDIADSLRGWLIQPRVLVGFLLIAGGLVWAAARGLHFYGVTPAALYYDLDQPPTLLLLVGAWILYRRACG